MVLVALAGCGDGIGAPDATVPPDSDRGLVRVHLTGEIADKARVFFQNADSSLVLATRSDAGGDATGYLAAGGFVTVVYPGDTQRVFTFAGVEPGDVLRVQNFAATAKQNITPVRISVPPAPNAADYSLYSSCGTADIRGAEAAPLDVLLDECGQTADMLVVAFSAPAGYLYRADVPVGPGKLAVFDDAYRRFERARVHVENVPPSVNTVIVEQSLISDEVELWGPRVSGGGQVVLPLDGGDGMVEHDMFLPPTGTLLTRVDPGSSSTMIGVEHVAEWGTPSTDVTIDFQATTLRPYLERAAYVRAEHALRWTESTAGDVPQAVLATFTWNLGGPGSKNVVWTALAPRGEQPVLKLPVLPDPTLTPGSNATVNLAQQLASIVIDGGYHRIRQLPLMGRFSAGERWPPDGPTGRVVYQDLAP